MIATASTVAVAANVDNKLYQTPTELGEESSRLEEREPDAGGTAVKPEAKPPEAKPPESKPQSPKPPDNIAEA